MALPTSIDMLAVYGHKDNPVKGTSLAQEDAFFSKNRKGGFGQEIALWGQLGLAGEWSSRPISLYGRNSASGTYGYFKEHALFKGDYKDQVKEQPGSSSVVQGVARDRYAIGYSGIGLAVFVARRRASPGSHRFRHLRAGLVRGRRQARQRLAILQRHRRFRA
ncbi:MAG: hypothetical protein HZB23_12055 [Deltaproteobacteria bacterium]|nr:hypothetical protein [Deltaproteobacteria bacterium]